MAQEEDKITPAGAAETARIEKSQTARVKAEAEGRAAKAKLMEWLEKAKQNLNGAVSLAGIKTLKFDVSKEGMHIERNAGSADDQYAADLQTVRDAFESLNLSFSFARLNVAITLADNGDVTIPPTFDHGAFAPRSLELVFSKEPKDKLELAAQIDANQKRFESIESNRTYPGRARWNAFRQSEEGSKPLAIGPAALANMNFEGYDLSNIRFAPGTRMSGSRFRNANIAGADFSSIAGLSASDFMGSLRDENTRFRGDLLAQISQLEATPVQVAPKSGAPSEPLSPAWGERFAGIEKEVFKNAPRRECFPERPRPDAVPRGKPLDDESVRDALRQRGIDPDEGRKGSGNGKGGPRR